MDENIYNMYKDEFEKGVFYFKRYYINRLYDYPTTFILKNYKKIIENFNQIGGIEKSEYIDFLKKHFKFSLRKWGSIFKQMARKMLT